MPNPPKTLPADFDFDSPPETLPADFDFEGQSRAKEEIAALLADRKPDNGIGTFLSSAWETFNPINAVKGLVEMSPPMLALRGLRNAGKAPAERTDLPFLAASAMRDQASKAAEEWRAGNVAGAVGHGVASTVPFIGPAVAGVGEEIGAGEYAKGLGHLAGMAAPRALPFVANAASRAGKRVSGAVFKNQNNPVEESALAAAEARGIPMSVGQRKGIDGLQRLEQNLTNLPGSASKAQRFYGDQQEALAKEAGSISAKASPISTDAYGAGLGVKQGVQKHIAKLKSEADALYGDVRNSAAANVRQVQIGTRPSPILSPSGSQLQTPIYSSIESPVDLAPVRHQLAPVYEELQRTLPVARRQASPAYAVLEDLMENGKQAIGAMDFDKALGAIKAITRDGTNPYLSNQAQGLAKKIVSAGESELAKALGTKAAGTLQKARGAVKSYYESAETLADLSDEPAALYRNLVAGQDTVADTLSSLGKVAPREVRTIGRTFLRGLFEKVTNEGGFKKSSGIWNEWQKMGGRTKDVLFGPALKSEIDEFMLAAKKLTENANPSGTAFTSTALQGAGAMGTALVAVATGQAELAAGAFGAAIAAPALMANILLRPGVAKSLTAQLRGASRKISGPAMFGGSVQREKERQPRFTGK